ncbi:MAG: L-seryl-tRNA(Sec) selenium transferase [Gemmatimonadaceae bacterium]
MTDPRRAIPGISGLLERDDVRSLLERHPRSVVVEAARRAVALVRENGDHAAKVDWGEEITEQVSEIERRSLRRVYNATGVILHTNLGRAPLAQAALDAIQELAGGFTNIEYDLDTGMRGSRYVHCVELLIALTGAEDAMVVNNCAAALVLSLSALARNREVIVSRGELVEIGGSFRVPDIMARGGATLKEVGTTNRTHLDDYRRAINPQTGAIAKIHRSNFAQVGFVADVAVTDLVPVAAESGIPILHDLGSGLMIDLAAYGLTGEPTAATALSDGATVVMMSGDKLLGGPQAGIVLGTGNAIDRLRKDPLARAMRVDKLTIAALTATLELYQDREAAVRDIPVLAMIAASPERTRSRCDRITQQLAEAGIQAEVTASSATVGAGAFPAHEIPSFAILFTRDAMLLEERLRRGETPVIGRLHSGRLMLDLRSVPENHDGGLAQAMISSLA